MPGQFVGAKVASQGFCKALATTVRSVCFPSYQSLMSAPSAADRVPLYMFPRPKRPIYRPKHVRFVRFAPLSELSVRTGFLKEPVGSDIGRVADKASLSNPDEAMIQLNQSHLD